MASLLISPGPVTTLTLNRPDVRNAFNEELIGELTTWARSVRGDGTVRVAILRGAGPVFSAGADVRWMSKMAGYTREENLEDARQAAAMFHALDSVPVPLIARVHGAALGGGAGLAAVADVVVAAEDAIFGFTEVALGILPAMISPYVVSRIGLAAARELCLSGARFAAARAREVGLVHDVVRADELDAAVERRVHEFLKAAPSAVARTKRLLREVYGRRPADVMALTVDAIANQRVSAEGQEGLRAFLEKRAPAWAAASGTSKVEGRTSKSNVRSRRARKP
jgi:methylglutaconyl-CoA hydratase